MVDTAENGYHNPQPSRTCLYFQLPAGAPIGNKNAAKANRLWGETIHRVVTQENSKKLREAAEALVANAIAGDTSALKELGDRLDGKVPQAITGGDGGPLVVNVVRFADDTDSR